MQKRTLKYILSQQEVNYLLNILNRVQVSGVGEAQSLLAMVELLKQPTNKEELEKNQLKNLKEKFELKKKKK